MRFQVRLEKTPTGFRATSLGKPECSAEGASRQETLDNVREEIRYRVEFCPCTWVPDDFVELDVTEG